MIEQEVHNIENEDELLDLQQEIQDGIADLIADGIIATESTTYTRILRLNVRS